MGLFLDWGCCVSVMVVAGLELLLCEGWDCGCCVTVVGDCCCVRVVFVFGVRVWLDVGVSVGVVVAALLLALSPSCGQQIVR